MGLALLTVALPPSPAVDAVEQRAADDRYQHAHHYPCCVRAWARAVARSLPWARVQQPTVMAASYMRPADAMLLPRQNLLFFPDEATELAAAVLRASPRNYKD